MNNHRKKKISLIISMILGVAIAAFLILSALKDNINLYFTPSELKASANPHHATIRLGGMVKKGSVEREKDSLQVNFIITDFSHEIPIYYQGLLPNLFREGQGVVVQGQLQENGLFQATTVLAKHDENYMPPKVAAMVEKQANAENKTS